MTTFEKIKKLLSCGTCKVLCQYEDGKYVCFSGIYKDNLLGSYRNYKDDVEKAIACCSSYKWTDEEIEKDEGLKIIQIIPIIHKEITGLVDILDCPETRELAKKGGWSTNKIEMIGNKGLKIKAFYDLSYCIYQKDKEDYWHFPVWAIVPHIEEYDDEVERAIKLLKQKGIIVDGKVLKIN